MFKKRILVLLTIITILIGFNFFINKKVKEKIKQNNYNELISQIENEEKPFEIKNSKKMDNYITYKDFKIQEFFNEKYYTKKINSDSFTSEISIVSQLTVNKINRLGSLIQRWDSEINVALYITQNYTLNQIINLIPKKCLQNIKIHLVYNTISPERIYPMNILRNIAWE
jgi:hypothetical protein